LWVCAKQARVIGVSLFFLFFFLLLTRQNFNTLLLAYFIRQYTS
jgi:hypothetical protein